MSNVDVVIVMPLFHAYLFESISHAQVNEPSIIIVEDDSGFEDIKRHEFFNLKDPIFDETFYALVREKEKISYPEYKHRLRSPNNVKRVRRFRTRSNC